MSPEGSYQEDISPADSDQTRQSYSHTDYAYTRARMESGREIRPGPIPMSPGRSLAGELFETAPIEPDPGPVNREGGHSESNRNGERPPFSKATQVCYELDGLLDLTLEPGDGQTSELEPMSLPDFPYISIPLPSVLRPQYQPNRWGNDLTNFLRRDLLAPDLEEMAPYLWMMSTQSSANISPLHHQIVKGRNIVITEDPRLHLVWIYDKIFIKPLPRYLLSWAFWDRVLLKGKEESEEGLIDEETRIELVKAAKGYLRSYSYLIRHPSDLILAHKHDLIPLPDSPYTSSSSTSITNPSKPLTLPQFHALTAHLLSILDSEVSLRYSYGELRLTRLNFYGKYILRRWYFQRVHAQYGEYFSRFYGPLLFIFTVLSLLLNALQVEMAVEQVVGSGNPYSANGSGDVADGVYAPGAALGPWIAFWGLSRYFAIITMTVIIALAGGLCGLLFWFHADEWIFAIRDRRTKKKIQKQEANAKNEGIRTEDEKVGSSNLGGGTPSVLPTAAGERVGIGGRVASVRVWDGRRR